MTKPKSLQTKIEDLKFVINLYQLEMESLRHWRLGTRMTDVERADIIREYKKKLKRLRWQLFKEYIKMYVHICSITCKGLFR